MNALSRCKSSYENGVAMHTMETGLSLEYACHRTTYGCKRCASIWKNERARHQFPTTSPEWTSNKAISHAHIRGM